MSDTNYQWQRVATEAFRIKDGLIEVCGIAAIGTGEARQLVLLLQDPPVDEWREWGRHGRGLIMLRARDATVEVRWPRGRGRTSYFKLDQAAELATLLEQLASQIETTQEVVRATAEER